MFAQIAGRYDLMNSLMSLRLHRRWRRRAVSLANLRPGDIALDVCCGTGDFALDLAQVVGHSGRVVGIDFCEPMLRLARTKADRRNATHIKLALGDALSLPLPSNSVRCATVGWGIRNVQDIPQAFREMTRVVEPGGSVICLDMAKPRNRLLAGMYNTLFYHALPIVGGLLSRKDAYTYLPNSVTNFPERDALADIMRGVGLMDVQVKDLAFGAICIHHGVKPCPTHST